MPLGKWKDFSACVIAQRRMGHSGISSRKICGSIQANVEGGSSLFRQHAADSMSQSAAFPPKPEEDGDGAEKVSIPVSKLQDAIQALADGDTDKALAILKDFVNIEEEATPKQPTKAPPFAR